MADPNAGLLGRLERLGTLAENAALVILLGSLILLAVGQIILREVFETGIFWADELIKLLVLWLAMVGSIAATRDNKHIRVDALSHLLPGSVVRVIRLVVDTFALVVCAVIAFHSYRYLRLEMEFADTVMIDTPAWVMHVIVPIAFALICYRFLVNVLRDFAVVVRGQRAGGKQ